MGAQIQRTANDNLRVPNAVFRKLIDDKKSKGNNIKQTRNDTKFTATNRYSKDIDLTRELEPVIEKG